MADDVTITVTVNNATGPGITSVNQTINRLSRTAKDGNGAFKDLKATLLSLAPAAVPVAAALAPIAVHAGAAGLAVAAFGAAVVPQIANLKSAATAQTKYTDAVTKYGANSQQAVQAQKLVSDTLAGMPQATQRASAAFSNLQSTFKGFSDSTAKFTMVPVEHSFAVLGEIIPKLTPMVTASATQLDRLVKVAGGAVNSSGFDTLSKKVADYANSSLQRAIDGTIHFARILSEGNAHGPIQSFMDYARQQGPAVKELFTNLAKAVANLLEGAAQAGPGLLTLVNAFAKLVAAVPPSLVGTLMSVYSAFRLIKLAGAGIDSIAGGFGRLSARVAELRAVSVAAGGGMAGLNAAMGSLSAGAKFGVVAGGVAALVFALHELSDNKGPVAVDALSRSLNTLVTTGKVTGALKSNFTDISESIAMVSKGASDNKLLQLTSDFGTFIGVSTGPGISTARKNVDAWDKSMANLVRGGHTKEAAAQYEILKKAWVAGGGDLKRLNKFTDDYKGALADQSFEAKMTAQSQGLFGQAAQDTAAKLDAQKASADGLRQSIQALNDANRQGLGGMIGFEQALDSASKAAKDNAGALSMHNGVLNLNSAKAQAAATALQDLADKTDSAAASQREAGASWETVNGIYDRGRAALIKNAEAMGLSKSEAAALASQILRIPDKTARVKMNAEDAKAGLEAFNAAVRRTPGSKSVTLKTLSSSAEAILESFGLKVKRLPDGRVKVTAQTGAALSAIKNVQGAINSLPHSRNIGIGIYKTTYLNTVHKGPSIPGITPYATGGPITGGSGTQDDVPIMAMGGEFMVRKGPAQKHAALLRAINDDRLPGYAKGGKITQAQKDARGQLSGQLGISYFGHVAGYQRTPLERNLGVPSDLSSLVSSLNELKGEIKAAFSGRKESSLLKALDSSGKKLISWEKQLTKVSASLASAKSKLDSLKSSASQLADSVKSGILSSANITKGASGGTVTVSSIMGGLTQSRDQATAFSGALSQLKAKGLSSALLQQIAEAGVEGGGLETAGALLGASGSEIQSLNSLQSQINGAAGAAGKTTADSVYGAAIKAQTAEVKKLQASQNKLRSSMDRLAKSMDKMLSRAVKGKAAGGIVGAAASGGMRGGLTWVGEQEPELLDLPAGSRVWSGPDSRRKLAEGRAPWASMLNTPRRAPSYGPARAPAGGGHGQPLVIQVQIGGRNFGELWVDTGRREVRARGGLEATLRPPRGR